MLPVIACPNPGEITRRLRGVQRGRRPGKPLGFYVGELVLNRREHHAIIHHDVSGVSVSLRARYCQYSKQCYGKPMSDVGQSETSRPNSRHGRFTLNSGLNRNDTVTAATCHKQTLWSVRTSPEPERHLRVCRRFGQQSADGMTQLAASGRSPSCGKFSCPRSNKALERILCRPNLWFSIHGCNLDS